MTAALEVPEPLTIMDVWAMLGSRKLRPVLIEPGPTRAERFLRLHGPAGHKTPPLYDVLRRRRAELLAEADYDPARVRYVEMLHGDGTVTVAGPHEPAPPSVVLWRPLGLPVWFPADAAAARRVRRDDPLSI